MKGNNRIINTFQSEQYFKQGSVSTCNLTVLCTQHCVKVLCNKLSSTTLWYTVLSFYDLQFTTKYWALQYGLAKCWDLQYGKDTCHTYKNLVYDLAHHESLKAQWLERPTGILEGHGFHSRWGLRKLFFSVFRLENASPLFETSHSVISLFTFNFIVVTFRGGRLIQVKITKKDKHKNVTEVATAAL